MKDARWARWLGVAVQSLVLGVLLFFAVVTLVSIGSGRTIFRYEGF